MTSDGRPPSRSHNSGDGRGYGGGRGNRSDGGGGRGSGRRDGYRGQRPARSQGRSGPPSRSNRPAEGSDDPARTVAYRVLEAVGRDEAYANLALSEQLRRARLGGRDAAFATELVFGVLRQQGLYDAVIAEASGRPVDRVDPPARDVLRLGVHQLLETRVPPHAAVGTSVALAHRFAPAAAGFVNAILRKVSDHNVEEWIEQVAPSRESDPAGYREVRFSHPAWIVRAFSTSLSTAPGGMGGLDELLQRDNMPSPVTLVARDPDLSQEDLLRGGRVEPGRWSPWAVRMQGGSPGDVPEVRSGRAGVQDEGSQIVTAALLRADVAGSDSRWLDMCAGPGGKAALLARQAAATGASVTALELHEHRVDLVSQAWRAVPGKHRVLQADARSEGWEPEGFDRVLLDAPCTGLGVLRRRPESRWRRTPDDLAPLTQLQRELLAAALSAVRVGGVVAYVTCSPHLAETDQVVRDLLRRNPGVTLESAPALLPEIEQASDVTEPRYMRLWPHLHDTDGMFLALLRRNE